MPLRLCDDRRRDGPADGPGARRRDHPQRRRRDGPFRAIIPCGPSGWYAPFTELVNARAGQPGPRRGLPHGRVPRLAGPSRSPASASLQLPRFHGGQLLWADRRRARPSREANRHWPEPARSRRDHRRTARVTGRPGVRRLGTGRAHRLQPGPAAPVQPGDASTQLRTSHRTGAGQQHRHRRRAGTAHVRRRLPVRPADVGDARVRARSSRPAGSGCSATPAPGSRPRCASACSAR